MKLFDGGGGGGFIHVPLVKARRAIGFVCRNAATPLRRVERAASWAMEFMMDKGSVGMELSGECRWLMLFFDGIDDGDDNRLKGRGSEKERCGKGKGKAVRGGLHLSCKVQVVECTFVSSCIPYISVFLYSCIPVFSYFLALYILIPPHSRGGLYPLYPL